MSPYYFTKITDIASKLVSPISGWSHIKRKWCHFIHMLSGIFEYVTYSVADMHYFQWNNSEINISCSPLPTLLNLMYTIWNQTHLMWYSILNTMVSIFIFRYYIDETILSFTTAFDKLFGHQIVKDTNVNIIFIWLYPNGHILHSLSQGPLHKLSRISWIFHDRDFLLSRRHIVSDGDEDAASDCMPLGNNCYWCQR